MSSGRVVKRDVSPGCQVAVRASRRIQRCCYFQRLFPVNPFEFLCALEFSRGSGISKSEILGSGCCSRYSKTFARNMSCLYCILQTIVDVVAQHLGHLWEHLPQPFTKIRWIFYDLPTFVGRRYAAGWRFRGRRSRLCHFPTNHAMDVRLSLGCSWDARISRCHEMATVRKI